MKKVVVLIVLFSMICVSVRAENNLIKNSTLNPNEKGLLACWSEDSWIKDNKTTIFSNIFDPETENWYIEIKNDGYNDSRIIQTLSVKPKTRYLVSGRIKIVGELHGEGGAGLSILDYYDDFPKKNTTNNKWESISFCFETEERQDEVVIAARLGFYGGETKGKVYFDDIVVQKITSSESLGTIPLIKLKKFDNDSDLGNGEEKTVESDVLSVIGVIVSVIILILCGINVSVNKVEKNKCNECNKCIEYKELIILGFVIVVYSIIAFYDLGNYEAPNTIEHVEAGTSVEFDLSEVTDFEVIRYAGINEYDSNIRISTSINGVDWNECGIDTIKVGDCFGWKFLRSPVFSKDGSIIDWTNEPKVFSGRFVRLDYENETNVIEYGFIGSENRVLHPRMKDSAKGKFLIDEQNTVPIAPSYQNSMFFDEIYHARTAYEYLYQLPTYEYTHPPLGKIFIMLGISVFGMTPFGWRFTGTLFGVLMIPAIFVLAKVLFGNAKLALLSAVLLAFDNLHFTQTRLATIDTYVVFFVILMYVGMFAYVNMDILEHDIRAKGTLLFSGISMGLACASKWTGVYAAGGIAILFFFTIGARLRVVFKQEKNRGARRNVGIKLASILLWCIVCFVIIPMLIYYCSYEIHFGYCGGVTWKRFIDEQKAMFDYHANLEATHPYQSSWYEWPLCLRPIWYYHNPYLPKGYISTILGMGNIMIWWPAVFVIVRNLWRTIFDVCKKSRIPNPIVSKLLIGYIAQILPWMFVSRCTFIYHYFPGLIFAILILVYSLRGTVIRGKTMKYLFIYVVIVILVFAAYYPLSAGIITTRDLVEKLDILRDLKLPWWSFGGWLRY